MMRLFLLTVSDVTSPPNPTIGIITIYDIFGMASQTLQGADILSSALNAVVLVPDFFKGESVKSEWMTGGDAGKQLRAKFMAEKAEFPGNVAALLKTVEVAKKKFPYVTAWGTYGLCWGGKVVAMASGANTPFKATGQVHAGYGLSAPLAKRKKQLTVLQSPHKGRCSSHHSPSHQPSVQRRRRGSRRCVQASN